MRRVLAIALSCFFPAFALAGPPEAWRKPAADLVAWFETSGVGYGMVTPDFDCQGLSAGVLQWNVGRGSLWDKLFSKVPAETFAVSMPTYGADFRAALAKSKAEVRGFQTFANKKSCSGNVRKAAWSTDGVTFAKEVSILLKSAPVVALQQTALNNKLDGGWQYATWWAEAKRGAGATPTYLEFATFTDTLNFNGTWKEQANASLVEKFRKDHTNDDVLKENPGLLGCGSKRPVSKIRGTKNARLWKDQSLDDESLISWFLPISWPHT